MFTKKRKIAECNRLRSERNRLKQENKRLRVERNQIQDENKRLRVQRNKAQHHFKNKSMQSKELLIKADASVLALQKKDHQLKEEYTNHEIHQLKHQNLVEEFEECHKELAELRNHFQEADRQ